MPQPVQMKSASKRWLPKILKRTLIVLLMLGLLLVGFATYTVRQSFPQESGTIQLPGLKAEVQIQRDQWGIPHIRADNSHDLFMAQGYVHAQDRFWQMDFWRHLGSGRLAEMFGSSQVDTDKYLRTMGWARVAQQEIQQMNAEMTAYLQAYADGVNAYLAHQVSAPSLEYTVLKFLNPGYKPEPWEILHSLTWGKVMAYDLGRNFQSEIERAILLKTLTLSQVEELFPAYPQDLPVILPELQNNERRETRGHEDKESSLRVSSSLVSPDVLPALQTIIKPMMALEQLIGAYGNWYWLEQLGDIRSTNGYR